MKCNVRLATLLVAAYRLQPLQYAPEAWMQLSWWSIEAKVPAGATVEQVSAMVRNLLAERFKLAVHFVQKEVSDYEMTVAKGGPKLDTGNHAVPPGTIVGSTGAYFARPITMDELAFALSEYAGVPIVNKTGIVGGHEFNFHVAVPPLPESLPPESLPPGGGRIIRLPLVEAVRDQLGLVLERTTSMVDAMVVDHIEQKPTKN